MIGETLGRYEIVEAVGRGGMAEVYKAYHPGLERYVAIKVLHSFLASEENFLARFKREAKAVAALRHPNIVQVYDFDYDQGRNHYYMVMEFIDGPSLKVQLEGLVAREERMTVAEAIRAAAAVGDALEYAHRRGMVHRDVKPANIMLTKEGQVILTDFGIARMVNLSGLTASGAMVGTPAYISPEQGLGHAGDERSDIYSLGVVFYQMVTGLLPFDADTPMGIVLKHINEQMPLPSSLRPDLPEGLERVLVQAMAKNPDQRYQAVAEFVADMRRVAAGREVHPPPPVATSVAPALDQTMPVQPLPPVGATTPPGGAAATPIPAPRRRWWIPVAIGAAAIVALLAIVIGGGFLGQWFGGDQATPTIAPDMPSPDIAATQFAATLEAIQAVQATLGAPTATPLPTSTSTPTPDLTATAIAGCVFDMEVVEDRAVWPSILMPGQNFTKRWTVRNSGTCAWREHFLLLFVSGEQMGGADALEVEPLGVGEEWEIELSLQAPPEYQTYTGVWQLQEENGNEFGQALEVTARVDLTPTPRPPTATPTPEATPTSMGPLHMSVPVFQGECTIDPWAGTWGGTLVWSAGGGAGTYYYFYADVRPDFALPTAAHTFSTQTGQSYLMKMFTTSASIDAIGSLPQGCCDGTSGRYVTPGGVEVVWQTVNYSRDNCP